MKVSVWQYSTVTLVAEIDVPDDFSEWDEDEQDEYVSDHTYDTLWEVADVDHVGSSGWDIEE